MKKQDDNRIVNVADYINTIDILRHKYPSGPKPNSGDKAFVFRGHADVDYKLLPGILRVKEVEEDVLPATESAYSDSELNILKHFIKEGLVYNDRYLESDYYHWIQLAQHYGVPTRLLDWTENPLVALYFACVTSPDTDANVWVLHKNNYYELIKQEKVMGSPKQALVRMLKRIASSNNPIKPFLFTPYYFDLRMTVQSSWFMAWGCDERALEDILAENYMSLDNPEEVHDFINPTDDCVFCFFIDKDDKQRILNQLEQLNINEKTLFPGLDSVGKFVNNLYKR